MTDRAQFEEWISRPPFEHMCDRFPEGMNYAGQYRRYETQMAWEAWQEARAWRPIAEAPKDGTPIDVWCVPPDGSDCPVKGVRLTDVVWNEPDDISPRPGWVRIMDDGNEDYVESDAVHPLGLPAWKPTHYQPLPPPPEPTGSERETSDVE